MLRTTRNQFLTILAAALTLPAADPSLGTWKLNVAKSKFSPGPAPKNRNVVVSQDGDWIVQKMDGVNAEGNATTSTIRFKFDGKEYPITTFAGTSGTIAVKRIDDYHHESVSRGEFGASNVRMRAVTVLSKDGKTRTQTVTGVSEKGEKFNNVVVYDRQ